MGEEKIIEYETVEKEKTITVCDECGEKENNVDAILPIGINPRFDYGKSHTIVCSEKDMCLSCIIKLFDIDIPDDEEVVKAKTKANGDVNIQTKKEVRTIYPNITKIFHEEWSNDRMIAMNWPGKIILWPLGFIGTIIEYDSSWGDIERQKGYLAASFGSILWFLAAFLVFFYLL